MELIPEQPPEPAPRSATAHELHQMMLEEHKEQKQRRRAAHARRSHRIKIIPILL